MGCWTQQPKDRPSAQEVVRELSDIILTGQAAHAADLGDAEPERHMNGQVGEDVPVGESNGVGPGQQASVGDALEPVDSSSVPVIRGPHSQNGSVTEPDLHGEPNTPPSPSLPPPQPSSQGVPQEPTAIGNGVADLTDVEFERHSTDQAAPTVQDALANEVKTAEPQPSVSLRDTVESGHATPENTQAGVPIIPEPETQLPVPKEDVQAAPAPTSTPPSQPQPSTSLPLDRAPAADSAPAEPTPAVVESPRPEPATSADEKTQDVGRKITPPRPTVTIPSRDEGVDAHDGGCFGCRCIIA